MASNNNDERKMTRQEAGHLGGEATAKKGSEYYEEIGGMQGKENNPGNFANRPAEDVSEAGKKGAAAQPTEAKREGGQHSHQND